MNQTTYTLLIMMLSIVASFGMIIIFRLYRSYKCMKDAVERIDDAIDKNNKKQLYK